jgi:hypothetical protein
MFDVTLAEPELDAVARNRIQRLRQSLLDELQSVAAG